MAKEFAKKFYNSKEWNKCRSSYIKQVLGLCERCNDIGYIVHHKIHLNEKNIGDHSISLSYDNLEYLCLECHNAHHNFDREKKSSIREGLIFNSRGELIEAKPPY
ncbi:MAG: HNH endonuclease [Clostridium sp.]